MVPSERLSLLKTLLGDMGSALVAYSGGVDSTFLAAVARETLGDNMLAALVASPVIPDAERRAALETARSVGFPVSVIDLDLLGVESFADNPASRCYYCRRAVFAALRPVAASAGLKVIVDGENADDRDDYRPGRRAAREAGVRSPLSEAGLSKDEIRRLSREMGLPTWDRPASPCLASRVPYGTPITPELLRRLDAGEAYLRGLGLGQLRLRHHGDTARIEVTEPDMEKILRKDIRTGIVARLESLGYTYVTLDLAGYRSGSLNVGLERENI